MRMDINCDMGEFPEAVADGSQEALMPYLTSVNIACGGHAGDADTMRRTVEQARRHGLARGAHPGYPDRANFGRIELDMPLDAVAESVFEQVSALAAIAGGLRHVKPHGALYNQAARDAKLARAIADGVARYSRDLALMGLAGSVMLDVFREAGFAVMAEAFADRRYEPDGSLRSRRHADALIKDPEEAAEQAARIAEHGTVIAWNGTEVPLRADSICIHGDTPGALGIARAVRTRLNECSL
mgnify:CR=1 FL=1